VLESLGEQADDVVIVEDVEHVTTRSSWSYQALAAQQPQLMRYRRFAQSDRAGDITDAPLGARDDVEDADARGVAEHPERLGQRDNRFVIQQYWAWIEVVNWSIGGGMRLFCQHGLDL
jgi:hypothetical protein